MKNERHIYTTQEPSCDNLWVIAIDGWYVRQNNSNLTFSTKEDAEKYIKNIIGKNAFVRGIEEGKAVK